jgi:pilus assembly protein CpaE
MLKIKVLIADDNKHTRSTIKKILELDSQMDIVGEAKNGEEVLDAVDKLEPEVIIMDISMPVMDGVEATRRLSIQYPHIAVIIMSINDESNSFKQSMLAGAKAYLVKPVSPQELNQTVKEVVGLTREQRRFEKTRPISVPGRESVAPKHSIISVYGTKGGVGKSVMCTNLAVATAQKTGAKVALADFDIQFGDVSIMMNLDARKTLSELIQESSEFDCELLENYTYERHGVHILAAPNQPELSELVTAPAAARILASLKDMYDYTFIDTPSFIDDVTLTALEASDKILLLVTLDLPTIKNVKKGLGILKSLSLLPRTRLVLNRSNGIAGISPKDVERVLNMKIAAEVSSDGKLVIASLNQGVPFVKINPRAAISKNIVSLAELIR